MIKSEHHSIDYDQSWANPLLSFVLFFKERKQRDLVEQFGVLCIVRLYLNFLNYVSVAHSALLGKTNNSIVRYSIIRYYSNGSEWDQNALRASHIRIGRNRIQNAKQMICKLGEKREATAIDLKWQSE